MRTVTIKVVDRNFLGDLTNINPIRVLSIQTIDAEPLLSNDVKAIYVVNASIDKTIYICGEQINSHTPVVLIENKIYKLNNLNQNHQFAFVGFTRTSGGENDLVFIDKEKSALQGWNLIPNVNYLAGENGTIQTINNGSGFTQIIGKSQDANTILIYKNYNPIGK